MMNYAKEHLEDILKNNVVEVKFEKVDGTSSSMICTLKKDLLPVLEDVKKNETPKKPKREPNPNLIFVWNIEKKGWRSFYFANILEPVKIIDNYEEQVKDESNPINNIGTEA